MKNILVPTDFSCNAAQAISYALNLFKCERTNFYFLHAFADEVYGPFYQKESDSFETKKETIQKKSILLLDKLVAGIIEEKHNPKHRYDSIAVFDALVDGVNDFVNEKNIDLIVMGTKGKTADKNITFGSQTVQVFKYVNCPVLAIPDGFEYRHPKLVLFPTSFLLPYKRRELKLLDTIAGQFKSHIRIFYISDFEDLSHRQLDNKQFLEESLPHAQLSIVRTSVKNKAKSITEYIDQNNVDLLVMVNSRHSFLEDMLYRSTIDEIGLAPTVPFLVMQNLPR